MQQIYKYYTIGNQIFVPSYSGCAEQSPQPDKNGINGLSPSFPVMFIGYLYATYAIMPQKNLLIREKASERIKKLHKKFSVDDLIDATLSLQKIETGLVQSDNKEAQLYIAYIA